MEHLMFLNSLIMYFQTELSPNLRIRCIRTKKKIKFFFLNLLNSNFVKKYKTIVQYLNENKYKYTKLCLINTINISRSSVSDEQCSSIYHFCGSFKNHQANKQNSAKN
jgi:hypothetical protein